MGNDEMMATVLREEEQSFLWAAETLGVLARYNELTAVERKTVHTFILALEEEVGPFSPEPSPDDPPLAATLSNLPRITDPLEG
jgi:hypothetical protein